MPAFFPSEIPLKLSPVRIAFPSPSELLSEKRILVLDGGRIAEDGTCDELIKKGGLFASLVESQRLDA